MEIKNRKFTLRYPKMSDLDSYYESKNDKTIAKNMVFFKLPYSRKDALKDLGSIIKNNQQKKITEETFVIVKDEKVIGEIQLCNIIPHFKMKLSYWVANKYRGMGIATDTVKLITKYSFKKYGFKRIVAHVRTFNKPSARVLEKAGYKLEGILRKNVWKNGKYYSDLVYAKVK